MGACHTYYDELRFDVRNPELTEVYMYIRCEGDCPHTIMGWHHKTFASTVSAQGILEKIGAGEEDPIMWPMKAPPQ